MLFLSYGILKFNRQTFIITVIIIADSSPKAIDIFYQQIMGTKHQFTVIKHDIMQRSILWSQFSNPNLWATIDCPSLSLWALEDQSIDEDDDDGLNCGICRQRHIQHLFISGVNVNKYARKRRRRYICVEVLSLFISILWTLITVMMVGVASSPEDSSFVQ